MNDESDLFLSRILYCEFTLKIMLFPEFSNIKIIRRDHQSCWRRQHPLRFHGCQNTTTNNPISPTKRMSPPPRVIVAELKCLLFLPSLRDVAYLDFREEKSRGVRASGPNSA